MPSLKELFKNKPLPTQDNKVGAVVYAVRNSKDIPISTANGLLNATVFPIVQKTLRSSGLLTARTRENLVESELVGLRAIRGLASPVIYGTSLIRFKRKTTNAVEVMKGASAGGSEGSNFVLGSTVVKLQDKALEIASKLGIEFPENLIPTRVSEKPAFAKKKVVNTMRILKELKDGSAGNLLGRFIAESAQGTPNQIGRQVLGTAISLARDEIKRSLTSSFSLPNLPQIGNLNPVVEQTIRLRNYEPKPYDNGNDRYSKKVSRRGNIAFDGLSGILTGIQGQRTAFSDWASQKIQYDASNFANPDFDNRITPKINNDGTLGVDLGALSNITPIPLPPPITQNIPARPTALQRRANKYSSGLRVRANGIEKLGIRNGSDKLNDAATWYSTDGNPPSGADGKSLDDLDLIPFRFYSIAKKTGVSFRATITGLSETISPSWNASKFIGNPYSFHTYDGVERSVSFSFKMYSLNGDELKRMWEKLSFLNTFAYPQTNSTPYVTPPFLKFTLGDMYKNKEGFVESLSFTIDDNTMWEVGKTHISDNGLPVVDNNLKDYKLPTMIDVQMTIKFVESHSTFWDGNTPKRVYYYGGVDQSKSTLSEIGGNMLPDGSSPVGLSETILPEVEVTATRLPSYGSDRDITKIVDKELLGKADANAKASFLANMSGLKATQQLNNQAAANSRGNIFKKIFKK